MKINVSRSTIFIVAATMMLSAIPAFAEDAAPAATPAADQPVAVVVKNDPKLDKQLLDGIKKSNLEAILSALDAGANPNASGKDGMTPLMLAVQDGKPALVKKLLKYGADPNLTNKKGQTALHLATQIGAPKPKKSKFGGFGGLLGGMVGGSILGGGLDQFGSGGAWASSLLGSGGLDSLLGDNLKGFLSAGAFDLTGKSGWSAIIGTALQGDLKSQGAFGLKGLLTGNLDKLGAGEWTNLIGAVKGSNTDVFNAMNNLAGGQNAQWTKFLSAAASGDKASVASLIDNPELQPLLAQATEGFSSAAEDLPENAGKRIVTSLLKKGANAGVADGSGKTALQLAEAREWAGVVELLKQ